MTRQAQHAAHVGELAEDLHPNRRARDDVDFGSGIESLQLANQRRQRVTQALALFLILNAR